MFIAQDDSACNNAESQTNKISISGNIVPSHWYHRLLRPCGKSDTTGIAILSELVFLHRYNGNSEFQLNFNYFKRKFNFGASQTKDAVIRLEQAELLKRSLRTVIVSGRRFTNEMFLVLHIENVLKLNSQDQAKKFPLSGRKEKTDSLEISSDNKIKKNLSRNRSSGSNFYSNSFLEKENSSATVICKQRFSLASFYPLVQSDIDKLQTLCGRQFSGNAINEILQNLSIKLPNHSFPHKSAFIKYMGKALAHEMRDAVKISNESFKIKNNVTSEEIATQAREEFLNEIENSRDTSPKMQLSRKLAGILEPSVAYNFLMLASFFDNTESLKTDSFKIILRKKLELSSSDHSLILAQVQSVYGNHINRLEYEAPPHITLSQNVQTTDTSFKQPRALQKDETKVFEGIWGEIRQGLIDYYGSGGNAMDNAWFSKLIANVDADNKKLTLKAPTKFIKDWVQSNYTHLIDKLCSLHSYSLEEVQYA
ncbi:DnaA-like protein [Candidatus Megaera venefica]|uniref:DnaA-like protein n=1 Tax=Candidatus Megaera venefica TaxID=2055910 RepID=A0ABU5ND71_9RICK|nr:DnaA N-terminal domain-containing protein [Candidatus Megaera venefica]MEA0971091.1 DnaA-like protein [Candidatus Megaera venefica]